jgi:FdhE protein
LRTPRKPGEARPDPTQIGAVAEAAFVRLPDPGGDFAARAARFAALAEGSPMAPYLRFLGGLASLQHLAAASLPAPAPLTGRALGQRRERGMPLLTIDMLGEAPTVPAALEWFAARPVAGAPAEAEAARLALLAMPAAGRLALAETVFAGAFPAGRLGEAVYVADAVQVHAARQAAALDPAWAARRETGTCPVCGAPPVASVRVGWPRAEKLRYCCCSLCGTCWNYVRIKCTACASTKGISYYGIDAGRPGIGAECCEACGGYIKHLRQDEDAAIDPFADDVGSYELDLMLRAEGHHRAGINPLFVFA